MKNSEKIVDIALENTQKYYSNNYFVYIIHIAGDNYTLRRTTKEEKTKEGVIVFKASKNFFDLLRYYYGKQPIIIIHNDELDDLKELSYLFGDMYDTEQRQKDKHDREYTDWVLYGDGWREHLREESDEHIVKIISNVFKGV